ncbi:hypothetical protein GGI42DRAFT_114882 [Trichoderma sp. SZMC 28013]
MCTCIALSGLVLPACAASCTEYERTTGQLRILPDDCSQRGLNSAHRTRNVIVASCLPHSYCCVVCCVLTALASPPFFFFSGLYLRFAFFLPGQADASGWVSPMAAGDLRQIERYVASKSSFPSLTFHLHDAIVRCCETWALLNDRCAVRALLLRGRTRQLPVQLIMIMSRPPSPSDPKAERQLPYTPCAL